MFLNNDYPLNPNSIPATIMPINNFKELLDKKLKEIADTYGISKKDMKNTPAIYMAIIRDMEETGRIPYRTNMENITVDFSLVEEFEEPPISGIRTLQNGIPFLMMAGCSDYAPYTALILYPYKDAVQLYIPIRGNTINITTNCFIGEETEITENSIDDDTYLAKYGMDFENVQLNEQAMLDELMTVMQPR